MLPIQTIDWRYISQRQKDKREDLIASFVYAFIGDIGGDDYINLPKKEVKKFLEWGDKTLSYLCSKWVYDNVWRVKGNLLPYIFAQTIAKTDDSPEFLRILFQEMNWDLDEALRPRDFVDYHQTVETVKFEYENCTVDYEVSFECCLPIKFGWQYKTPKGRTVWTVQWWEDGKYELISDGGKLQHQTEKDLKKNWVRV